MRKGSRAMTPKLSLRRGGERARCGTGSTAPRTAQKRKLACCAKENIPNPSLLDLESEVEHGED